MTGRVQLAGLSGIASGLTPENGAALVSKVAGKSPINSKEAVSNELSQLRVVENRHVMIPLTKLQAVTARGT
jgi:hypothetical protein